MSSKQNAYKGTSSHEAKQKSAFRLKFENFHSGPVFGLVWTGNDFIKSSPANFFWIASMYYASLIARGVNVDE